LPCGQPFNFAKSRQKVGRKLCAIKNHSQKCRGD
jgi:hypothetical protein